jgi:hypothetical protein
MYPGDGDGPHGFQRLGHKPTRIGGLPQSGIAGGGKSVQVGAGRKGATPAADNNHAHLVLLIEPAGSGGEFDQHCARECIESLRAIEPQLPYWTVYCQLERCEHVLPPDCTHLPVSCDYAVTVY